MTRVRELLLVALSKVVGWTSPDQRYLDLISPGNSREQQTADAKKSDCILVTLGVQEMVFAFQPHPSLNPQVTLEERAGGTPMSPGGAMRAATFDNPPQACDAVWYGKSAVLNAEHVEHVVAVKYSSTTGDESNLNEAHARVVAGGERDIAGDETIKLLTRVWHWKHGAQGDGWYDDATARKVIGVIDADLLANTCALLSV